jgi:hypothetical protein
MFFLVLSLYLTLSRRPLWLLPVLALLSLGVLSGHSRVGTVLFLVAFVFVLGLTIRIPKLRIRQLSLAAVVAVGLIFVSIYANQQQASEHSEGYTVDFAQKGWSQRFSMWRAAFDLYQEYPLAGSGPGTFKIHYPRFRDRDDMVNFGNFVHNDYLQFLVEGGPVLLLFLLAFTSALIFQLYRQGKRLLAGDSTRVEVVVLIVGLGAVLAHSLMNFALFHLQVQILIGIGFARVLQLCDWLPVKQLALKSVRALQVGLAALVILPVMLLIIDTISDELVFQQKVIPVIRDIPDDPSLYYESMVLLSALRNEKAGNRIAMATLYRQSFDRFPVGEARYSLGLAAVMEYRKGLELNPWHDKVRSYFARFLEQNPIYQTLPEIDTTPEVLYREGTRLTPFHIEAWMRFAFYLERIGRGDEAYQLLVNEALPWMNLQHGDYHQVRYEFMRAILNRAGRRNDQAVLAELLARM